MACFIVPGTEAVITTIATKIIEKKELKEGIQHTELENEARKELFSTKLKRLNGLLWGGTALLAFEHLWHGEIQPFFPFLTAAGDANALADVFHEMATVGVGMSALVTFVWAIITFVTSHDTKKGIAEKLVSKHK